ncbi:MAG: hypothetical protein HY820_25830 [Acidobacteria bacterium]|nr:hypothetical protein [Acidobacteriota bacterium]
MPTPIGILHLLAAATGGRMDMPSLMAASEMPVEEFAKSLRELETADLARRMANRWRNLRQRVTWWPE